ncbi:MAG TPA: alpha/beta fold hydrolase [Gemmatimonadaceae bacterium]|jgi:homoserine O-acetyltransferase|nr:alpha/beta fold hydrolase [Gemmatimonadaceae bacterium]
MLRLLPAALLVSAAPLLAQAQAAPAGADYTIRNFKFESGETLPELRLHYITLGKPRRDARGIVRNAVVINHGTGGTGGSFMSRTFAGELFGSGQLLDTAKYFIVLQDGIGHGKSSKPSDGLHARFPKYTYNDMVEAQHELLTRGLGVNHLRLVMGTSMGCMHAWVWGERYPDFMDGLVPLACAPTQIAGRNRMIRTMIMDAIRNDPGYNGGDYTTEPLGLRNAEGFLFIMTSAPKVQHRQAPTRDKADSVIRAYQDRGYRTADANDMLYQFDASRTYDPSRDLEKVTAPVLAINSADDFVNPPELGLMEQLMPRVKHGKYVLLPITDQTRGHGTHSLPAVWKGYLADFLSALPER